MSRWLLGIFAVNVLMTNIAASPVSVHGALKRQGTKIIGSVSSLQVQLAGPSLYWTIWGGEKFYNGNVVAAVAGGWNASLIRAAIAVEYTGGYLEKPAQQIAYAKTVVDAAVANGIYVLVDWHDHNANLHIPQAKEFFTQMSATYKNTPNVIWEIWNEPDNENGTGTEGYDTWEDIRAYADSVIPVIRANSGNLIVVGTPNWSGDPLSAAKSPLGDSNVAYTLHFYAGTHGAAARNSADSAISKGAAIFITEFGTTDAAGGKTDETVYLDQAKTWLDWADMRGISWANWSLSNIDEPCSELKTAATASGNWPDSLLSPSGIWVKQRLLARPSLADTDSVSIILTMSGNGTVTVSQQGLKVKKGTAVTFTAVPSGGWVFESWSGVSTSTDNPLTLTAGGNIALVATFSPGAGMNMLQNGDFSNGGDGWISWVDTSSAADVSYGDSQLTVTIAKADSINWHIQVVQKDIALDSGSTYAVSLDAWSSGERSIFVGLSTDKTWHFQGGSSLNLAATKQTFTFNVTPDSTTAEGVFQINFGTSTLPVYIDNVIMCRTSSISAAPRKTVRPEAAFSGFVRRKDMISWPTPSRSARVSLMTVDGRVIATSATGTLRLTGISQGVYLVVMSDGIRREACPIIK